MNNDSFQLGQLVKPKTTSTLTVLVNSNFIKNFSDCPRQITGLRRREIKIEIEVEGVADFWSDSNLWEEA